MSSQISLNKELWGPALWQISHQFSLAYPETPNSNQSSAAQAFFESLRFLLPCEECQDHYAAYLAAHPVATSSRKELSQWVTDLHNDVVSRTGRGKQWSLERVQEFYLSKSSLMIHPKECQRECAARHKTRMLAFACIALLLVVIYLNQ